LISQLEYSVTKAANFDLFITQNLIRLNHKPKRLNVTDIPTLKYIYLGLTVEFLGALAKLRKATISFVMSVCPSVSMEEHGSHWTDFDET
jgi:uncharacterized membrane protein